MYDSLPTEAKEAVKAMAHGDVENMRRAMSLPALHKRRIESIRKVEGVVGDITITKKNKKDYVNNYLINPAKELRAIHAAQGPDAAAARALVPTKIEESHIS